MFMTPYELRQRMVANQSTSIALAAKLDVSRRAVALWRKGHSRIPEPVAVQIRHLLPDSQYDLRGLNG